MKQGDAERSVIVFDQGRGFQIRLSRACRRTVLPFTVQGKGQPFDKLRANGWRGINDARRAKGLQRHRRARRRRYPRRGEADGVRSEEHTSELQSLMRT